MTSLEWIARVREKLELARAVVDRPWQPELQLAPLPAGAVDAFEREHGVRLPEDFRALLEQIGCGGGPSGGIYRPGARAMPGGMPRAVATVASKDGSIAASSGTGRRPQVPPPRMERPFRLAAAWSVDEPLPLPGGASPYDGCLYLSDQGCGCFDFLVVQGERAGEVWTDDTATRCGGAAAPTGRDFRSWFDAWLDGHIASALGAAARAALRAGQRSTLHERIAEGAALVPPEAGNPDRLLAGAAMALYLGRADDARRWLEAAEALLPADDQLVGAMRQLLDREPSPPAPPGMGIE